MPCPEPIAAQVAKAVHALKDYNDKKGSESNNLLDDAPVVSLQISFKRDDTHAKDKKYVHNHVIPLEHSIYKDTSDLGLIVKQDHEQYLKNIKKNGPEMFRQVVDMNVLKTQYKTFESRRQLAASCDAFYCDKRLQIRIPQVLGKSVLQSRAVIPITVPSSEAALKLALEKAARTTTMPAANRYRSCKIGHMDMEEKELVANAESAVSYMHKKLNFDNVQEIALLMKGAPPLPVYSSVPYFEPKKEEEEKKEDGKKEGKEEEQEEKEEEEEEKPAAKTIKTKGKKTTVATAAKAAVAEKENEKTKKASPKKAPVPTAKATPAKKVAEKKEAVAPAKKAPAKKTADKKATTQADKKLTEKPKKTGTAAAQPAGGKPKEGGVKKTPAKKAPVKKAPVKKAAGKA
ncbi:ribosomal protein L1p/L10e family-domain-containing protein [Syncephalastrum racemosum]|uniref:Ribosomal protein L1p/L10e family-domain-containing protein n=1 Tax=Syncephalastrum racemosum TaxID=13706 RepID=A0A1X2H4S8_SYNRA|nr:ribosomal protein L1p/L10e family-domain-containing protein [Syncephalastrum racemosum]